MLQMMLLDEMMELSTPISLRTSQTTHRKVRFKALVLLTFGLCLCPSSDIPRNKVTMSTQAAPPPQHHPDCYVSYSSQCEGSFKLSLFPPRQTQTGKVTGLKQQAVSPSRCAQDWKWHRSKLNGANYFTSLSLNSSSTGVSLVWKD